MERSFASKLRKISGILSDVPDENLAAVLDLAKLDEENRRKRKKAKESDVSESKDIPNDDIEFLKIVPKSSQSRSSSETSVGPNSISNSETQLRSATIEDKKELIAISSRPSCFICETSIWSLDPGSMYTKKVMYLRHFLEVHLEEEMKEALKSEQTRSGVDSLKCPKDKCRYQGKDPKETLDHFAITHWVILEPTWQLYKFGTTTLTKKLEAVQAEKSASAILDGQVENNEVYETITEDEGSSDITAVEVNEINNDQDNSEKFEKVTSDSYDDQVQNYVNEKDESSDITVVEIYNDKAQAMDLSNEDIEIMNEVPKPRNVKKKVNVTLPIAPTCFMCKTKLWNQNVKSKLLVEMIFSKHFLYKHLQNDIKCCLKWEQNKSGVDSIKCPKYDCGYKGKNVKDTLEHYAIFHRVVFERIWQLYRNRTTKMTKKLEREKTKIATIDAANIQIQNERVNENDTEDFTSDINAVRIQKAQALDLPDELWHKIFGYLSTGYVLKNISLVCQRFGKLSNDAYWMKSVSLNGEAYFDQVRQVMSKAICLQELSITHFEETRVYDQLMETVLQTCKTMKKLKIVIEKDSRTFSGFFLELGKSIEHLDIQGPITDEGFTNIVEMKNLKTICLTPARFQHFNDLSIEHLIALTKDCQKLERISIGKTFMYLNLMQMNEVRSIFKAFFQTRANQLKCFDLDFNYNISYNSINSCEELEHLSLNMSTLPKGELASISKLSKLKYLKMRNGYSFPARELKKFFDSFDGSELIKLDLSRANLTKTILTTIIKKGGFPNLKYLWLDDCKIASDVEIMKQFIRCCPKLKVLSLVSVFKVFKSETMQAFEEEVIENKLKIVLDSSNSKTVTKWQGEKMSYEEILQKYHDNLESNETKLSLDCQH